MCAENKKKFRPLRWLIRAILLLVGLVFAVVITALLFWGSPARWPQEIAKTASYHLLSGPAQSWWGPLVRSAAIHGKTAYIGQGTEMGVLDISDGRNPRLLRLQFVGGILHGTCQNESTLFVAAGPSGLTAFDIRNPNDPQVLDRFTSFGYGMFCTLQGDLAAFANERGGWALLDVSNPGKMTAVAQVEGGWVSAAILDGDLVYVLDGWRGLDIYDITDRKAPVKISNLPIHHPDPDPPPVWLERHGRILYVANGSDGFRTIDAADPANPQLIGHLPLPSYTYSVTVRGDTAWLANIRLGLVRVDVSNPAAPVQTGRWDTPGGAYDVVFRGDRGYLSDGANGFLTFDLDEQNTPHAAGYFQSPPSTRSTATSGDLLVAANESAGLAIYDISAPDSPRLLSKMDTKGLVSQVAFYGERLVVVDVLDGAHIVDIREPTQPKVTADFIPEDHPWGVAVDGDVAYIANGSKGFSILDLTAEMPVMIANDQNRPDSDLGYLIRVAKNGDLALVTDMVDGAWVYNVADPRNPLRLAIYPALFSPVMALLRYGTILKPVTAVSLQGEYAYLAADDRGMWVLNLQQPDLPRLAFRHRTKGHAFGVAVEGDTVVLAEYEGTLTVFHMKEPGSPELAHKIQLEGELQDVRIAKDHAFVSAGPKGFAVVDLKSLAVSYIPIAVPKFEPLTKVE